MKTKLLLTAFLLFAILVSNGQWTQTFMSEAKIRMGGATLGTQAYFAGGEALLGSDWFETNKVEIYDIATDTWQIDYLTQARVFPTGVTCRDRVFFAGGIYNFPENTCTRVDIYNSLGIWDIAELSFPRFALSAVSNDSLVLFAGGGNIVLNESYDVVDIYDITTNQWSVDHLSAPRAAMGSAVAGDLAFFAGGDYGGTYSKRVDIYHFSTGTWTIDSLSMARTWIGATAAGNKVIFAGGGREGGALSDVVDIYDIEDGTWETAQLSMARGFFGQEVVTVCGKVYFTGGSSFDTDYDTIDVYDPAANEWSVMTMPNRLTWHTAVAIDSSMLIAGGFTYTTFPYGNAQNNVEIWTDTTVGMDEKEVVSRQSSVVSYPNPTDGIVDFRWSILDVGRVTLKLYDIQGREVAVVLDEEMDAGEHIARYNAEGLPAGIYFYRLTTNDYRLTTGKLVKY